MMAMSGEDLEERIREVCGQLNAAHARLVELVAEAEETGAWAVSGVRSLRHWLTWQAGVAGRTADTLIRLAAARTTHPAVSARFTAGELTVEQAAIAVTVPAHCDTTIADLAVRSTVAQLHIEARIARPAPQPASERSPESVSLHVDDDGRFRLRGDLDADHGRLVDAALHEARDRLFHAGQIDVTWVDALIDVINRSLDAAPPARRQRFRVNLFLDPATPIGARWADGTAVPDAITRHLTCDATLTPTFTAHGRPVDVGRSQRIVADRTRRLVHHRDRACRVPWCANTHGLEVHHVRHWRDGGRTDMANLITLCAACHRQHHHGTLGIHGDANHPDGLTFTDTHGHPIDPTTRPHQPTGPPPPPPPQPYRHPTGERLQTRWLTYPPAPTAA